MKKNFVFNSQLFKQILFLVALSICINTPLNAQMSWSMPTSPVESNGRLALGNGLHVVGHIGGNLVHRLSLDNGVTWNTPTIIAPAYNNFPMMYGGFFAIGDSLYLLTAEGDMSPVEQHADFRKSIDKGKTWTKPIRITSDGFLLRRARIVAHGNFVHVAGLGPAANGYMAYFRSTDGGVTWASGVKLADSLGTYGGGQTIAIDGNVLHIPYTKVLTSIGAGPTYYIRSADNGVTWSVPLFIGETNAESHRQARVQVCSERGKVFVIWQREADSIGLPLPADRLAFNRSNDSGKTWLGVKKLPDDKGVEREHQHVWMTPEGAVYVVWWTGKDTVGYKYSPDFGVTWGRSEIALIIPGPPVPYSLVADNNWVHLLTSGSGTFQFTHKSLIATTSIALLSKDKRLTEHFRFQHFKNGWGIKIMEHDEDQNNFFWRNFSGRAIVPLK